MNKLKTLFFSIIIGLAVAGIVFAWTNPTANPPSGGGALYYYNNNVGIHTLTPNYPLTVSTSTDSLFGLVRIGAANPVIFKVGTDSSLVINASSTDVLTLKQGNVGIGTTSPNAKLTINGGFYQNAGMQIYKGTFNLTTGQTIELLRQNNQYSQAYYIVAIAVDGGWHTGQFYDVYLDGYGTYNSATLKTGSGSGNYIALTTSIPGNRGALSLQNTGLDTYTYYVTVYAFQMWPGALLTSSYVSLN